MPRRVSAIQVAALIADVADDISSRLFFQLDDVGVSTKRNGTLVTDVDMLIEEIAASVIQRLSTGDGILGEEGTYRGSTRRRWVIDPIDGTSNFANRGYDWGTHVYFERDGTSLVAIITRPGDGRRWVCVADDNGRSELYEETRQVSVRKIGRPQLSSQTDVRMARIGGFAEPTSEMRQAATTAGAQWIEVVGGPFQALLIGELDAVIDDGGEPWDMKPRVMMIGTAGGAFRDPAGGNDRTDLGGGCTPPRRPWRTTWLGV